MLGVVSDGELDCHDRDLGECCECFGRVRAGAFDQCCGVCGVAFVVVARSGVYG